MNTRLLFFLFPLLALLAGTRPLTAGPGDTTVVRTFRFDTNARQGVFQFPDDPAKSWEKILMLYSMRCKNGLVSNSTYPNQGCGEWDYNCYTYVVDSSRQDSLRISRNSHDISNFTGSVFPYTTEQVFSYIQYLQQEITYDSILAEDSSGIGNGQENLVHPLGVSSPRGRAQYLWTAAELAASGLNAGPVTGLRLQVTNPGSPVMYLKIKMKHSSLSVLDPQEAITDSLTEVYFLNTSIPSSAWQEFRFHTPFLWDGLSSILLEFSYSNHLPGLDNVVSGHDAGSDLALVSTQADAFLSLGGGLQLMKLNPGFFGQVTDKISIAFWCKGDPEKLPANTSIMEALGAGKERQLNIHLPWSNSRVYWDCGNDGSGYDRIDKEALAEEIEGRWNFWTFTKNAVSGEMKIFKNAELWASGSGKTRLIDLHQWLVGAAASGSNPYHGFLDEISIWNIDLDEAGIAQIMYRDIEAGHPDYSHLQAYFRLNEGSGNSAQDDGPLGQAASLLNPGWQEFRGEALFRNFEAGHYRPNVFLVQGIYDTSLSIHPVLDSNLLVPASVISYMVSGNNLQVVDTLFLWQSGYAYIHAPDGSLLDSIAVIAEDSIIITQLTYYQRRPMHIELINFITPYGLGLNLNGLNGRTWVFDVSDYASVLKGPLFMAMSDGIYQEDNDITFVFYEGTPSREVISLQQVWPSGSWVSPSYNDIYNDKYFEARSLPLPAGASMFKLRSAISGHGQQGEFVPRTHTLTVNDTLNFPFQVWKHCSDNPIYPQGGTWVYARAGWCPGAVVDTREIELGQVLAPGQSVKLDYSLPYNLNPGASNYRVNHQLVSYGPPNFTLDASLEYIKQPSDRTEFIRMNPVCNEPVVAFRNTGSTNLTNIDIVYGRAGGTLSVYPWNGNLGFMETREVTLPMPDWNSSNSDRFVAYVAHPNGGTDQYALNDTIYTKFVPSIAYPNNLVIELKTNNRPWENTLLLLNSAGDTVLFYNNMIANTLYKDTLDLPDDCYTLKVFDSGDDGLSFWANSAQGSGYCRIRSSLDNTVYKTFNPDFGDNIYLQFKVELALDIREETQSAKTSLQVFPNPASNQLQLAYTLTGGSELQVDILDILGKHLVREKHQIRDENGIILLDLSSFPGGTYFIRLQGAHFSESRKFVLLR